MSRLELCLLGKPEIYLDRHSLSFPTRKAVALLAYLSITGKSYNRDALSTLFWPELEQTRARSSLRHTLWTLGNVGLSNWLEADRESIELRPGFDLDVAAFQERVTRSLAHNHPADIACPDCLNRLIEAAAIYRGDFLAGFTLKDSPEFDNWQCFQTESLRQRLGEALEKLVGLYSLIEEWEPAIEQARRWVALDPMHELSHRILMCFYAQSGKRGLALKQYEILRQVLEQELGVEPEAESKQLYDDIRNGGFETSLHQEKESKPKFAPGMLINQRYRLENVIGEGGIGSIYSAWDTLLQRRVAVKVLQTTGLGSKGRAKLLQEAQITAKLIHPNIITVYDAGEVAKTPYLVMELIEGTPLDKLIPLPVEKILALTTQICSALEYAHQHEIVHRDLKPGNILLETNGQVKLMDFGLARSVASRMTTEGAIAGTVFYMAPEQALGKALDGRADLYSLGVILYELATGEVPFTGEDPLAVIGQHLHAPIVPPQQKREDIPAAVNDLILKLLSKEPGDRPGSAAEVLKILDQISKGEQEAPRPVSLITGQQTPAFLEAIQEMGRPVFVARESELEQLSKTLEGVLRGKGCIIFVTGDAGRGKTALLREFARQASKTHPDLLVAAGSCNPYSGVGDPYLPLRSVLRTFMGNLELAGSTGILDRDQVLSLSRAMPQALQALVSSGSYLVDTFIPGSELLAEAKTLGAVQPELRSLVERGANQPYDLAQQHLFEQYCAVLRALSKEHSLLILLDDLQWVDSASAGLLYHLGSRLEASRILVLCAYRPEEVSLGRAGERHPLAKALAEFKRRYGEAWLDLASSDEGRGRQFVDVFLDTENNRLGEGFRKQLFQHTEGHALFTIELLRAMQERGDLVKDQDGFWVEGPVLDWASLPAQVEAVIAERIGRLDDELRQALNVASVEGEEFTAEVVARVMALDTRQLTRQLSEEVQKEHHLVRAQGLKRVESRLISLYRFQHNLFQQYLYNGLDPIERASLHEEVGNVLEALYEENTDEIAPQLASHYEEAGLPEKAVRYLQRAGELAAARFANQEALDYFSRALSMTPQRDLSNRYKLLLGREKVYDLIGARDLQKSDLNLLEELANKLGPELQAVIAVRKANFANHVDDYSAAIAAAQSAVDVANQIGSLEKEAAAYFHWGSALIGKGDYPSARIKVEKALAQAQNAGVTELEARCLGLLGLIEAYHGNYTGSQRYLEQVIQLYRKIGDRLGEGIALNNMGFNAGVLSDPFGARSYFEQALKIFRQIGARYDEPGPLYLLGEIACDLGDFALARSYMEQCIPIIEETKDRAMQAASAGGMARVLTGTGEYLLAIEYGQKGLQIVNEIGEERIKAFILFRLGVTYKFLGDFVSAKSHYEQALKIVRRIGERSYEMWTLQYLGDVLLDLGEFVQASDQYEQALRLSIEIGPRVDEAWAFYGKGKVQFSQGHFEQAAEYFRQAAEIWEELRLPFKLDARAGLAQVLLSKGKPAEALSELLQILKHFEAAGNLNISWEPAKIYLTAYQVLQANGDPRAEDFLQSGYNIIQERAYRIDDADLRRSYLENVPYNREIIQLWEARQRSSYY